MIVTFPQLGPLSIVLAQYLRYMDIPFVVPSDNSREVLEKGMAVSPEEMCMPFKYMAGNFMDAYEKGADTALIVATCGPCRLGEYGELLKQIMQKAGCKYEWILLESPGVVGVKEIIGRLGTLTDGRNNKKRKIIEGVRLSVELLKRIDNLKRETLKEAGYLKKPYDAVRVLHEMDKQLKLADSFKECFTVIKAMSKRLECMERNSGAQPVKVLVAGEIYTSIESEANGRIEEKLMKMGCSVMRHIDLSWWVKYTVASAIYGNKVFGKAERGGDIPCTVGGYGRETAARIKASDDVDGIIKVMPSGCMPEIVTKAYCEKLQKEEGRRILHLIYDEMSGTAGYDTRIEAFVDMLERRKGVLAGN